MTKASFGFLESAERGFYCSWMHGS